MQARPPQSSFEDVELETGFQFTVMDPSRSLVIDASPRVRLSSVAAFIFAMLLVVLASALTAPKDHFVEYSLYRVNVSEPNSTFSYRFAFSGLDHNFTRMWLTILSVRDLYRPRHYDGLFFTINASEFAYNACISHISQPAKHAVLHYPPHSHNSDPVSAILIPLGRGDRIVVNASVTFDSTSVSVIVFEWSLNNPHNPEIEHRAYPHFLLIAVILGLVCIRNCRRRIEQLGTVCNLLLFFTASFSFTSHIPFFHIAEQLMTGHLRAFLFYVIAYIANKHNSGLTQIGFALIATSFALDLSIAWYSWKTRVLMIHGHDIVVHMLLVCILGSIVTAMARSAEDRFAFTLYSMLMACSLAGTLIAHDLCIVMPHFEHWIEPRFLFYGVHIVVLTVLVYFHQGMEKVDSESAMLNGKKENA
jgi:hypothetical protein